MKRRTYRKFRALLLVTALAAGSPGASRAEDLASEWVEGFNNKARILAGTASGGPLGSNKRAIAGIEIAMSAGFKTYWRNPGEAGGVPPEFDFSSSQNLADARVLYPVPHRTADKAGENIGYKDSVIFPVVLTPVDAAKPVTVNVNIVYGVCKDICIPAEAGLSIVVPPAPPGSEQLAAVLETVPVEGAAAAGDPFLAGWRTERDGPKLKLTFEVANAGAAGDAFLFSADGLYMPMTRKISTGAKDVYEADLTEGADVKELAGKSIAVTLAGEKGQAETTIQLPKDLGSP